MATATATRDSQTNAPGPIEPTETCRFSSHDGTGLYGEWFAASAPRAACLISHGYAEHCGRYRELAHVLTGAGVAALSYDMRGHGRSDGQRGYTPGFRRYLDDFDAALAELETRTGDAPLLLLGHSNGALVTLRALCDPMRAPARAVAAVVSSPFLGLRAAVPRAKQVVGRLAGRFAPTLSLPNGLTVQMLTSDPQRQREAELDTLRHDVAAARWFTAAERAQQYVVAHAGRIEVPTLWLVAGSDQIADPARSRMVRARLRAPSTYIQYDRLQHEVFNETDRARVFGDLLAFIDETFPK